MIDSHLGTRTSGDKIMRSDLSHEGRRTQNRRQTWNRQWNRHQSYTRTRQAHQTNHLSWSESWVSIESVIDLTFEREPVESHEKWFGSRPFEFWSSENKALLTIRYLPEQTRSHESRACFWSESDRDGTELDWRSWMIDYRSWGWAWFVFLRSGYGWVRVTGGEDLTGVKRPEPIQWIEGDDVISLNPFINHSEAVLSSPVPHSSHLHLINLYPGHDTTTTT